jgi:cyclic pyranopterin phosphate synthase
MPEDGIDFLSHNHILSYEEMLRLVEISTRSGIRKVRLTGGEPLVRKGFINFLEKLCEIEELQEITLTTNGVLLKKYAKALKECGICRINVSLDTLKAERFSVMTGRDQFDSVWEGIQEAERIGFNPIKINVVAIKGVNDDEILDFARLTYKKSYHIRFIELMPVGEENIWSADKFISTEDILQRIKTMGPVAPILSNTLDGPAKRYILDGGKGEIGLIGALSHHFCDSCNRLRLTAEGHLRSCLFSDQEIDVKTPLREGKGDDHIFELINRAIENKPQGHGFLESGPRKCIRQMSSIGG